MSDSEAIWILFFYVVLCALIGAWSSEKGGSFIGGFFMAVIISPLLAGVILAVRRPLPYKAKEPHDSELTKRGNVHPVIATIVIAGAIAIVVYFIMALKERDQVSRYQDSGTASSSDWPYLKDSNIAPGTSARVFSEKSKILVIATSEKTLDELLQSATKDNQKKFDKRVASLRTSGRVFFVSNNTAVVIVEVSYLKTQVVIMDGPKAGMSGWLLTDYVVPSQVK